MINTDTISETTDRLETIIAELESGDASLQEAKELHEEGEELVNALEEQLDLGDGSVREIAER